MLLTTPHICAQNDLCHEASVLGYLCWGTRDPSPAAPRAPQGTPPPRARPKRLRVGGWGQDLGLRAPMDLSHLCYDTHGLRARD